MYMDRPVREYLKDLAARIPAPGGGSAAALSAAIGTGLMSMVANYTIGNPKYKNAEQEAADILVKTDRLRQELELLVDKDVEAYNRLSKAIKACAKNSPELDKAYKEAASPPFEICRIAAECMALCKKLAACGNKGLITDAAIAAILLEGAFFSAKFNVYINLKYIKDTQYIESVHKVLSPLEAEMPKLKEEILEGCEEVVG